LIPILYGKKPRRPRFAYEIKLRIKKRESNKRTYRSSTKINVAEDAIQNVEYVGYFKEIAYKSQ
jgi:hypothetical protein